jgi:hypothetical protein
MPPPQPRNSGTRGSAAAAAEPSDATGASAAAAGAVSDMTGCITSENR